MKRIGRCVLMNCCRREMCRIPPRAQALWAISSRLRSRLFLQAVLQALRAVHSRLRTRLFLQAVLQALWAVHSRLRTRLLLPRRAGLGADSIPYPYLYGGPPTPPNARLGAAAEHLTDAMPLPTKVMMKMLTMTMLTVTRRQQQ